MEKRGMSISIEMMIWLAIAALVLVFGITFLIQKSGGFDGLVRTIFG